MVGRRGYIVVVACAAAVECRLCRHHEAVYGAFAEQGVYYAVEQTRYETASRRLWVGTAAAVPPQPYLLAEKTALQEVDHSLLHAAQQGVVGHAVEGQHVYEYALVHVYVLEERLREHGAVLAHLGEIVWRMGVGVLPRQEVALPELGRSYAQEAFVCVACHAYRENNALV